MNCHGTPIPRSETIGEPERRKYKRNYPTKIRWLEEHLDGVWRWKNVSRAQKFVKVDIKLHV